jgi:DNA-binding GntR family transcriptional regulator
VQPGFPAIEQRPISRQVYEALRALIVDGEAPTNERLYGNVDAVATQHLPLIDAIGRRDIAVAGDLMQIYVRDGVEPVQTRLLLPQESAA